jgi:anaerobic ribonucleoside-triphosphate reductase activating protein
MQPFIEKELIEPADLAARILAYDDMEGITLSGGEPFLQAQGLSEMIEILQAQSDLSVFTYTGYTLQHIQEKNDLWWDRLLSLSDILVDGEYIEGMACDLLWRGSSNQKMYFLTDRYRHLEPLQHHRGRYLLFDVTQDGDVIMIGIPSPSFHKAFTEKLEQQGVQLSDIDAP